MLRGILGLAKNLVKSWFITAESLFIRVEEATLVLRFLAIDEKKVLKPSAILRLKIPLQQESPEPLLSENCILASENRTINS